MQFNKKGWVFPFIALVEFLAIAYLVWPSAPAESNNSPADQCQVPAAEKNKARTLTINAAAIATCTKDDDCPSDSVCASGKCLLDEGTGDNSRGEYATQHACATAEDCGCGYDCLNDECHKSDSCCANADCLPDEFCDKSSDETSGTCAESECDADADCDGGCAVHCINHRCDQQPGCCAESDCPVGYFCRFSGLMVKEGYCEESECNFDSDCDCGEICNEVHSCSTYSPDRPILCCEGDFYYEDTCHSREEIEDGNCLDSSHCPGNEICNYEKCFPPTCAKNSDCGCEAVCDESVCMPGCEEDSDCCDADDICHYGNCKDPEEAKAEQEQYSQM